MMPVIFKRFVGPKLLKNCSGRLTHELQSSILCLTHELLKFLYHKKYVRKKDKTALNSAFAAQKSNKNWFLRYCVLI
jgi:hypothetical protein